MEDKKPEEKDQGYFRGRVTGGILFIMLAAGAAMLLKDGCSLVYNDGKYVYEQVFGKPDTTKTDTTRVKSLTPQDSYKK